MILSKLGVVMKSISKLILCILCVSACDDPPLNSVDGGDALVGILNDSQVLGGQEGGAVQEDAEMREVNQDESRGGSETSDLEFIDMLDMNVALDMEMLGVDMVDQEAR